MLFYISSISVLTAIIRRISNFNNGISKWVTPTWSVAVLNFKPLPSSVHLCHTPSTNCYLFKIKFTNGSDYSRKSMYGLVVKLPTTSRCETTYHVKTRSWFYSNPRHKRWLSYCDCYSLERPQNYVKTSCNCFSSHSALCLEGNGLFIRIHAWGISAGCLLKRSILLRQWNVVV